MNSHLTQQQELNRIREDIEDCFWELIEEISRFKWFLWMLLGAYIAVIAIAIVNSIIR